MASKISCELCGDKRGIHEKKDIRVYFCPKCKSTEVRYTFGLGNLFGVIPKMRCLKCGYTAPGFPILETNKKEIAKVRKKKVARKSTKKKVVKRKKKGAKR